MRSNLLKNFGVLTLIAVASFACSKDKGGGGGGGQPAAPITGFDVYTSEVFDNSYGQPRFSIRRDSIVNTTLVLRDLSDTRTNYINQLSLQFDSMGALSANATIDIAAFDHHRNSYGFGVNGSAQVGGGGYGTGTAISLNGMPQQGPIARPQGQIVNFRGVNIGYEFDSRTGKIVLDRFFLSSGVTTNPFGKPARLAITVGVIKEKTTRIFGRYPLRSAAYKFEIPGRLIDLRDEHILTSEEVRNLSVLQGQGRILGIDIGSQIRGGALEIAAGDIIAGEGSQYNCQNQYGYQGQVPVQGQQPYGQQQPYGYQGGYNQQVAAPQTGCNQQQVQIPVFVRDGSKSSFLYLDPILDPRGFRPY